MHAELREKGFTVLRELTPHLPTTHVAAALGKVIDVGSLLPSSGVPTVQSLRPRAREDVGQNQYSGHYGLEDFPLHSDLAHWAIPPRYFLLRCIAGAGDVFTRILPWTAVLPSFGKSALQRAVFAGRKKRFGSSGLVRAMCQCESSELFRWDPVFLRPLNRPAQELAAVMGDPNWSQAAMEIPLCRPGDTIVIDNWRMLHGRSPVPEHSISRFLERVYLSEVAR
jgi:alpha-ketoglutarate-dependent taurine dioxygenase